MTDDVPGYERDEDTREWPADPSGASHSWLKPLLLFATALVCGLLASAAWMHWHPRPVVQKLPSDTALPLDPDHRALPAPMAGGTTNLPPPAAQAPDAPRIVSPEPDAAVSTDSTAVDAATNGAETAQAAQVAQAQDASGETASSTATGPQVSNRTSPDYPAEALRAGVEGTAHLTLSIDADGNVVDVKVERSSGSIALDRAAIDTVRGWHYKPAMRDGQRVPGTVDVPIDFKLGEGQ